MVLSGRMRIYAILWISTPRGLLISPAEDHDGCLRFNLLAGMDQEGIRRTCRFFSVIRVYVTFQQNRSVSSMESAILSFHVHPAEKTVGSIYELRVAVMESETSSC